MQSIARNAYAESMRDIITHSGISALLYKSNDAHLYNYDYCFCPDIYNICNKTSFLKRVQSGKVICILKNCIHIQVVVEHYNGIALVFVHYFR